MRKPTPEYLERYKSSGLTQQEFCKREGIRYSQFHYYKKTRDAEAKLEEAVTKGFVTVTKKTVRPAAKSATVGTLTARLYAHGVVSLEITGFFSPGFLRELAGC